MEIEPTESVNSPKIQVIIRKRPINKKELKKKQEDIVIVEDNQVIVNEERNKLDMTKYVEQHHFAFDKAFDETQTNDEIYKESIQPIIEFALEGGKVSCFAYGQTGSGKTHTMIGNDKTPGFYVLAANDIFQHLHRMKIQPTVKLSYFEIYCGKLFDLLNKRNEILPREDKNQNIQIVGLQKLPVFSTEQIFQLIDQGNQLRVTSTTGKNEESSRSHAILQIRLHFDNRNKGLLSFIDLAGNERGGDTYGHDQQTRIDGAEISKSLLALKECIRALDQDKKHIPFRGSKLTMVLKDSFIGKCKTVMIGNISPADVNCEYTLNTLRYADRVKELKNDKSKRKQVEQLMLPRQRSSKPSTLKSKLMDKKKPLENKYNQSFAYMQENRIPEILQLSGKKENPRITELPQSKKIMPIYKKFSEVRPLNNSDHKLPTLQNSHQSIELLKGEHDNLITEILKEEESIISQHKLFLSKSEQIKKYEQQMIDNVDKPGSSIEDYINSLELMLNHKNQSIVKLQNRVLYFKSLLQKEKKIYHRMKSFKENCQNKGGFEEEMSKENLFL